MQTIIVLVKCNGQEKKASFTESTSLQQIIDWAKAMWSLPDVGKHYGAFYKGDPYNYGITLGTFKSTEPTIEVKEVDFKTFNPLGSWNSEKFQREKTAPKETIKPKEVTKPKEKVEVKESASKHVMHTKKPLKKKSKK